MSGVEFVPTAPPPPPPAGAWSATEPPDVRGEPVEGEPSGATAPRLGRRSLTSRLVTGVVGLVVVLVLAIGGGTYFALRAFLAERLDQQLQGTVRGTPLDSLFSDEFRQSALGLRPPQGVWAVALDTSGNFIGYSANSVVQQMHLSRIDRARLATVPAERPISVETTDGHELRVLTQQAKATANGITERAVAVIGLSTDEERRTLSRVLALEIIIGGSAIVIAIFATYGGVRFSLRGLRRVTTTAQDVAAELSPSGAGLDRRVPVTEEGTEIAQLTDSMNTLLFAVETQFAARIESEERMRQFLADASHELRTPLTSIRGFAELARMQRAVGQSGEDNIGRIENEGTRMSRLVEDLLMLARGDSGATARAHEPVDVTRLVTDAVSSSRAAYPERDIYLDVTPSYVVLGDYDQLLRVVRNLIANAAVHTPPMSPIRVRGFAAGAEGSGAPGVAIQVVDGGPGLSAEDAAHVFERFWRADKARTRARGGSGLGLSIVASIVQAHGGTVRFDSSVEAGSVVTVWLPAPR